MADLTRRTFLKTGATAAAASAVIGALPGRRVHVEAAGAGGLRAGAATRDVTPPAGIPMWGYGNRTGPSEGTLDPLFAKALVLGAGDTALAIVVTDMGRMPLPPSCARIREAAAKAGVADVIFSATHTHSGPILEDPALSYPGELEAAIIETIAEAAKAMAPARIGVGRTEIDISHNRRVIVDGQCRMRWRNVERLPNGPIDRGAGVIRIDTLDGAPIAHLIHYACHPVVLGPDNLRYSGDWSGEMCAVIEKETGAPALFLQGAAGDINPYFDKTPLADGGEAAMRSEGRLAAAQVLRASRYIETADTAAPRLVYREEPVAVGTRWDLDDPGQIAILREALGERIYNVYLSKVTADLALPLGVLTINDVIAFAFTPGEPFIQHQIDFAAHSPLPHSFLCGYANDFHIYFPTVRDAALGGYGGITATYVGLGAGDKLVTQAAVMAGESIGRLGPIQGVGDFALIEMG